MTPLSYSAPNPDFVIFNGTLNQVRLGMHLIFAESASVNPPPRDKFFGCAMILIPRWVGVS